jgi:ADP-ribose pyrophosphatase YjhB (NUDIX family)
MTIRCHRSNGVAALIVAHRTPSRDVFVALQLRGPNVGHSGTWAAPAGTVRRGEDFAYAAYRETVEEMGPGLLRGIPRESLAFTHRIPCMVCQWRCETFLVHTVSEAAPALDPDAGEVDAAAWVHVQAVNLLPLHPDFARVWNDGVKQRVAGEPHQATLV